MKKYKDFTLSLACFDALPVVLFSASVIIFAINFNNPLFTTGAVICIISGSLQVLWKILVAGKGRDIQILNKQMFYTMTAGILLAAIGIKNGTDNFEAGTFWAKVTSLPCSVFFSVAFVGMALMSIFARTLDSTKAKSNWIEQITNTIAQGALLIGIILTLYL